jgi:hypothetical protein
MFIAALFTIAKLWKQPRCPTTYKWVKTIWYLYTMKFYSAIKKNEILSFAGKWMEVENIILSEVIRFRRLKITCSPSSVDYRPKTDVGDHKGGIGKEKEIKNLNVIDMLTA